MARFLARQSGAHAAVALVMVALGLASCVEREERIVVRPDGLVDVVVTHRSESLEDLLDGDALPDANSGWETDLRIETDAQGDDLHVFEGRITTAFGAVPGSFVAPRAPDAETYLQFPSSITVERRRDGTWYHFRRSYQPRRWAELAALHESPAAKRVQDVGSIDSDGQPNIDQLESLARALVDIQVERTLLFARRAIVDSVPSASQDGWLRARESLAKLGREIDARPVAEDLAKAMGASDESKRMEAVKRALKRLERQVDESIKLAVRTECGLGGSETTAFLRTLARHRLESEVSEDLGDDAFKITVEMPGVVMGTNGTALGGGVVRWEFKGADLFDRPLELLVSSRVAD